jgi:hypothetical protein
MEIIRPIWKDKLRNIDILIQYLSGVGMPTIAKNYSLGTTTVWQISKIQIESLFNIKSPSFSCVVYRNNSKAIALAKKYREFLISQGVTR